MHSEKKSHLGKCIFVHGTFFESFKSVESTLSNDPFRKKKIKGKLSYILSMVYFLMKMTSSKISQWTKICFLSLDFFLNASFKSVESTLLNDVFRKKILSWEVYFHLWCMSLRTLFLFFENGK